MRRPETYLTAKVACLVPVSCCSGVISGSPQHLFNCFMCQEGCTRYTYIRTYVRTYIRACIRACVLTCVHTYTQGRIMSEMFGKDGKRVRGSLPISAEGLC